jgi:succinate-semialdehyde dehydrogenase/glutarate-semialdehyde dehydrogenase
MTANIIAKDAGPSEIVSVNPATLEELGRFKIASAADVNAAVARARAAQPGWAALSYRNRARYILKVRRELYDRKEEIMRIISDETGKPEFEALTTEIFMVSDLMSHFATKAERILRDDRFTLAVFRNKRSAISYEPLGVVAARLGLTTGDADELLAQAAERAGVTPVQAATVAQALLA